MYFYMKLEIESICYNALTIYLQHIFNFQFKHMIFEEKP